MNKSVQRKEKNDAKIKVKKMCPPRKMFSDAETADQLNTCFKCDGPNFPQAIKKVGLIKDTKRCKEIFLNAIK